MVRTNATVRAGFACGATLSGTALAGLLLAAPPANADDLDISPARVSPGGTVLISGGCQADDRHVELTGAAQGEGTVNDGWYSIEAHVRPSTPGRYTVNATCSTSGHTQIGRFTVRKVEHERRAEQVNKPVGWAETGGGGTQGPGTPWTALGLALAAGATGVGGAVLARSRAGRGRV